MSAKGFALRAYLAARAVAVLPFRARPRRPLPQKCRKILLVRIDRIGDLVLSTPFLRNFREAFPSSEVVLLGTSAAQELLADGALVDRIEVYDKIGGAGQTLDPLTAEQFDLAVDMHYDYTLATALLTRRIRAACSVGFDLGGRGALFDIAVSAKERKHFIDETFDILRALDVVPRPIPPAVAINPQAFDVARGILSREGVLGGFVAFHGGGFYPAQRWPAGRFARLADMVTTLGLTPVFVGARADATLLHEISGAMTARGVFICGQSVGVAAALIARSTLFVGNNSGPLHVACALHVPSVSTMGPTDPVRFWPVSDHARVVRARTVEQISVEQMFAAIKDALP
jgi:ADP-heptose:LPS heptosyltransferase